MYVTRPVASAISSIHKNVARLSQTKSLWEMYYPVLFDGPVRGREPYAWCESLHAVAKLDQILTHGATTEEFISRFVALRALFYREAYCIQRGEVKYFPSKDRLGDENGFIPLEQTEDQTLILCILGSLGVIQRYAESIARRPTSRGKPLAYRTCALRSHDL